MIRRMVVCSVLVVIGVGLACGPPPEESAAVTTPAPMSVDEAVQELVRGWDAAMRSGDAEEALALYVSDDPGIMPPDQPAQSGPDGVRTVFEGMLSEGGLEVKNRMTHVLSEGSLVIARGTYDLKATGDAGEARGVEGKWVCVTRRREDGTLAVVRNIWNTDSPAPGVPLPAPVAKEAGGPAQDAPCLDSPTALDVSFQKELVAGNLPVLVANHAESSARLAPDQPAHEGRDSVARYLKSRIEMFSKRELVLSEISEHVTGDLGYTTGKYRLAYTPLAGGAPVKGAGKYLSVARRGADGCWRAEWVIWNRDAPAPAKSS